MRASYRILVSAILLPALLAGKVKSYPDPKADFAHYKTYQWLPPRVLTSRGIDENHPAAPVIKGVVEKQLSLKGLKEVADGADLQIQTWVLTESIPQLEAIIFSVSTVSQGDVMSLGGPVATIGRYNKEGALYVNLIDTKTKKSAWLAMASDSLPNKSLNPEEIQQKLEKVTKKIFSKYPKK